MPSLLGQLASALIELDVDGPVIWTFSLGEVFTSNGSWPVAGGILVAFSHVLSALQKPRPSIGQYARVPVLLYEPPCH